MDNYGSLAEKVAETEKDKEKKFVSFYYHTVTPTDNRTLEAKQTSTTETFNLCNSSDGSTIGDSVPDYLPLSILSVFLFFPLGIPAVVHSCKVRSSLRRKDTYSARQSSRSALQLGLISVMVGPFLAGLTVILVFFLTYST